MGAEFKSCLRDLTALCLRASHMHTGPKLPPPAQEQTPPQLPNWVGGFCDPGSWPRAWPGPEQLSQRVPYKLGSSLLLRERQRWV